MLTIVSVPIIRPKRELVTCTINIMSKTKAPTNTIQTNMGLRVKFRDEDKEDMTIEAKTDMTIEAKADMTIGAKADMITRCQGIAQPRCCQFY